MSKFQEQLDFTNSSKWVADSALYSKEKLLKNNEFIWLTRVPETINEAKVLVSQNADEIIWNEQENGYKTNVDPLSETANLNF